MQRAYSRLKKTLRSLVFRFQKLAYSLSAIIAVFPATPVSAEPLKVGIILPLTGPASGNTPYGTDGIEFAKTRRPVNANLQFYVEDYGSEPSRAVSAYKKLSDINGVPVILVFGSPAAMTLKPLVEREGKVMLAIASANNLTSTDGNAFRLVSSADEESQFIAERWLSRGPTAQTPSVVHVLDDYGESYLQSLRGYLSKETDQRIGVFSFLPKETDFKPLIIRLRSKSPSAVVIAAFAQPSGLFLRQARELKLSTQFICPLACYNPDLFTQGQGAEEGLIVTTPANPQDRDLIAEFRKLYQYDGNFMSWGFYDALLMLAELTPLCENESEIGLCLKRNLRRKEGFSTSRGQLAFDAKGEMPFKIIANVVTKGSFVAE